VALKKGKKSTKIKRFYIHFRSDGNGPKSNFDEHTGTNEENMAMACLELFKRTGEEAVSN
jgi:hypothetical protein